MGVWVRVTSGMRCSSKKLNGPKNYLELSERENVCERGVCERPVLKYSRL